MHEQGLGILESYPFQWVDSGNWLLGCLTFFLICTSVPIWESSFQLKPSVFNRGLTVILLIELLNPTLLVPFAMYALWIVGLRCASNQMDPPWTMALLWFLPAAELYSIGLYGSNPTLSTGEGLFAILICTAANLSCSVLSAGWATSVSAPTLIPWAPPRMLAQALLSASLWSSCMSHG